jgi:hypothetical protein
MAQSLGLLAVLQPTQPDGGVLDRVIHAESHEPPEQEVVDQLLDELPLAPDGVEQLEHQGAQQPLGRDGGPARLGIEPGELRGQLAERRVDHGADRPQGVVGRERTKGALRLGAEEGRRRKGAGKRAWDFLGSVGLPVGHQDRLVHELEHVRVIPRRARAVVS